jgi:purine-nucleoside phosphorylase
MTSTALDAILSGEPPAAVETLRRMGVAEPISTAIVLGTGLGSMADAVESAIVAPYADLPGFPQSKVSGHAGRLVIGQLEGQRVALLQGRSHYYESGAAAAMATPLATVAALGARTVLLTNSAGSLRNTWHPGTVVVISDHINYAGMNPLIGDTSDKRFVSMTEAYDRRLRERLHKAAASVGLKPQEGVYIWFSGPSFETPAEVRMARLLGGDVVGMSTVPETILARRLGLRVAAISVITNFGAGIGGADPSHSETKDVALAGTIALRKLARAFIKMRDD